MCRPRQARDQLNTWWSRLDYVRMSYTLTGRQGRLHKTVRIECVLAFIDIRSTK